MAVKERTYCKVASSSTSQLELLMKGIFDAYVLQPFEKTFIFGLVKPVNTHDYTVAQKTTVLRLKLHEFTKIILDC